MRQVRKLIGFSQGKMARLLGIDNQSTYGNYESGRAVPLDFVIHFHEVCNQQLDIHFSLDWLLREEGRHPVKGTAPGATAGLPLAGAVPGSRGTSRAGVESEHSNDIDRQISEELELVKEVAKQLVRRTSGETEPADIHPYLHDIAFFIIDSMTAVRYASPGVHRVVKATRATVVGQSTTRYMPPGEVERVIPEQIEAMKQKGYWAGELDVQTSELKRVRCLHFQFLLRDDDGLPCMGNILIPMSELDGIRKEMEIINENIMRHVRWEGGVTNETQG
jgi:hypothetical protein